MAGLPHTCSSCSHVDTIDGVLTQATLEQRLGAKTAEITALKSSLATSETKSSGFDAVVAERDGLKTKITGMEQAASRSLAYNEHGIAADEQTRGTFQMVYDSQTTGVDDAPTFADWLGSDTGAKAHPLLKSAYGQPATTTTTPAVTTTTTPTVTPSSDGTTRTQTPAGPQIVKTPAQVQAFFQSEGYRSLPPAEQKAKLNEMKAQASQSAPGLAV